jgi:hypothetical protein
VLRNPKFLNLYPCIQILLPRRRPHPITLSFSHRWLSCRCCRYEWSRPMMGYCSFRISPPSCLVWRSVVPSLSGPITFRRTLASQRNNPWCGSGRLQENRTVGTCSLGDHSLLSQRRLVLQELVVRSLAPTVSTEHVLEHSEDGVEKGPEENSQAKRRTDDHADADDFPC